MALTRARVLVGSGQVREELGRIIESVLRQPREEEQLRADVLKMRDEMAQHKAPKGVLDAKLLRGGLVDLRLPVGGNLERAHRIDARLACRGY